MRVTFGSDFIFQITHKALESSKISLSIIVIRSTAGRLWFRQILINLNSKLKMSAIVKMLVQGYPFECIKNSFYFGAELKDQLSSYQFEWTVE